MMDVLVQSKPAGDPKEPKCLFRSKGTRKPLLQPKAGRQEGFPVAWGEGQPVCSIQAFKGLDGAHLH